MVTFSFKPSAIDSDKNLLATIQVGDLQRYCADHKEIEKSRDRKLLSTSANRSPFSRAHIQQVHVPRLLFILFYL